jgi:phage terminase small subunit
MKKPNMLEEERKKISVRQGPRSQLIEQLPRVRFTPMQHLFIEAYLVSKNITKAAIAAGCKERSAHAVGWKWFNKTEIRAEIDARLAATLDRYAVTSDRIIRELAKLAFGNLDDFIVVQDDGTVSVDFGTATREQVASLSGIEIDEYSEGRGDSAKPVRRVKLKFSEKRQALMDLAKLTRMMPADRIEHSGGVQVEHKLDIAALSHEQRDQLRTLLLAARKPTITDVDDES